jgi:hypothetical protein
MVNWRALFFCLVSLGLTGSVSAHPFHISLAEAEFNATTGRLEVSLKVHAVDMERALSQRSRSSIDLEKSPPVAVRELMVKYLEEKFYLAEARLFEVGSTSAASDSVDTAASPTVLQNSAGDELKYGSAHATPHLSEMTLIGYELETSWLWIYFELEPPSAADSSVAPDLVLFNTVLTEVNQGQINTVSIRYSGNRHTLRLTEEQRWLPFQAEWCSGVALPAR